MFHRRGSTLLAFSASALQLQRRETERDKGLWRGRGRGRHLQPQPGRVANVLDDMQRNEMQRRPPGEQRAIEPSAPIHHRHRSSSAHHQSPRRHIRMNRGGNAQPHRHTSSFPLPSYVVPQHDAIVSRVAQACAMQHRLAEAEHLGDQLSTFGSSGDQNPFEAVARRCAVTRSSSSSTPLASEMAEERCGILARVHRQRQRQRMRAVSLMHPSDVQLSEILHNGRVVTLTHVTQPREVTHSVTTEWRRFRSLPSTVAASSHATTPGTSGDRAGAAAASTGVQDIHKSQLPLFGHFVLHKSGTSWCNAVELLVNATGLPASCFAVNMLLDDQGCTTQMCSVLLPAADGVEAEDSNAASLRKVHTVLDGLFSLNLQAVAVRVQWVGLRRFACGGGGGGGEPSHAPPTVTQGTSAPPRSPVDRRGFRCNLLLRGFTERPSAVRAAAKRAASVFPNYFAARRFALGERDVAKGAFYYYHVAEAIARGEHRNALAMLAQMVWFAAPPGRAAMASHSSQPSREEINALFAANVVPSYPTSAMLHHHHHNGNTTMTMMPCVQAFAHLIRGGETSEERYKVAYATFVPRSLQQLIRTSRECLVFNTLLSMRLQPQGRGDNVDERLDAFTDDGAARDNNNDDTATAAQLRRVVQQHQDGVHHPRVFDIVAVPRCLVTSPAMTPRTETTAATADASAASSLHNTIDDITTWFAGDDTPSLVANQGAPEAPHKLLTKVEAPRMAAGESMGGDLFAWKPELSTGTAQRIDANNSKLILQVPSELLIVVEHDMTPSSTIDLTSAVEATASSGAVVVLPLSVASHSTLALWRNLGLTAPQPALNHQGVPPTRRAFLGHQSAVLDDTEGSLHRGDFPVRLRTMPELSNALHTVPTGDDDSVVRLATDVELLRSAKEGKRFGHGGSGGGAAKAAADATMWPIGRRGHLLSDRLPVGAFATDTSAHSSSASQGATGGSGSSRQRSASVGAATASTALAMQFDVPVGCYISSMLREFVSLRRPLTNATTTAAPLSTTAPLHEADTTVTATATLPSSTRDSSRGDDEDDAAEGNLLAFTLRGNVSLADAVRAGRISDVHASGKSVPRFLGKELNAPTE